MAPPPRSWPLRTQLLARLHEARASEEGVTAASEEGVTAASEEGVTAASVSAIAAQLQTPPAEAWEAALASPLFAPDRGLRGVACTGLACRLAGAPAGDGHCLGRCYEAPAAGGDRPFPEAAVRGAGPLTAPDVEDPLSPTLFAGREPERLLELVETAGLRGRGGAYFPVARKWRTALAVGGPLALVVNAEEGEPGVFKDRAILACRPRRFVEGLGVAMAALRPACTAIFVNGEAMAMRAALTGALSEHGHRLPARPEIFAGGGGYVLGEETTLLEAIEGRRAVPRARPPFPAQAGLFGLPTVVNNVETIASLSVIARDGAARFRARGTDTAPGTKLLSVSGRVSRPGLYEVALGTPLAAVLERAGAPAVAAAVLAGGPSGGFLGPEEFGVPLLPGLLHPAGASLGAGGLVVLNSAEDVREAALAMAAYNAAESCGKCTPCREGTAIARDRLAAGDIEGLDALLETIEAASLCGLGQMAPGPIRSAVHFWPGLFR